MGDRINIGLSNDNAYRTLENVNSWIISADNKSSILIALIGLLVGLSSGTYRKIIDVILGGSSSAIIFAILILLIYLICLSVVLYNLVKVFIARLRIVGDSEDANLISFISISQLSRDEYIGMSKNLTNEKLNEMLLAQINVNSKIALAKMKYFNLALLFSIVLIPLTIVLMFIG